MLIRVVPAAWDAVLSRSLEPLLGSWESVCDELAASSRCQVGEGWSTGGRVIAAISGPWLFCFFCSSIFFFLFPSSCNQMSHVLTAAHLRDMQSVKERSEVNQSCALGVDFAGYLSEGEITSHVPSSLSPLAVTVRFRGQIRAREPASGRVHAET